MQKGGGDRGRRFSRILLLAAIMLLGLSYRLYLARFHSEIGIPGLASWWFYITDNVIRLAQGRGLSGTLYAPGQSWAAYLIAQAFHPDPAVLRICFGLMDGLAILFLYLLVKELMGGAAGLTAAFLYALWPEGAAASINILHDHSPQPIFLFAGFLLLSLWMRREGWQLLAGAGLLLGLPPLFRTDATALALLAAGGLAAALWWSGYRLKRAAAFAAVLVLAALAPSLPYDFSLWVKEGTFTHIAAGNAGSAVFIRHGRSTGAAGTRQADLEVAFVNGVGQPFGKDWWDAQRMDILGKFGVRLLLADPARYLDAVSQDSWHHLSTPSGYLLWWPRELASFEDLRLAHPLRNPEWPLALLTALSRIQEPLSSRPLLLALALCGVVAAPFCLGARALPICSAFLGWTAALLVTLPVSRYMIMPYCLAFVLAPAPFIWLALRLRGKGGPTGLKGQCQADEPSRQRSGMEPKKLAKACAVVIILFAIGIASAWLAYPSSRSFWSQTVSFGSSLVPGQDAVVYSRMSYQDGDYTLVIQDLQSGRIQRISGATVRTALHGVSNGDQFLHFYLHRNQLRLAAGSISSSQRVERTLKASLGQPFQFPVPRLTPDGAAAAFVFQNEVMVWDLHGASSEVFPIIRMGDDLIREACINADLTQAAVVHETSNGFYLRVHRRNATEASEVVREGKAILMRPQWLPDGSGLTFIERSEESWKVQRWTAQGSRIETLYQGPRFIETAELHPDGRRLLLTLGDSGSFEGYFSGLHSYFLDLQSGQLDKAGP